VPGSTDGKKAIRLLNGLEDGGLSTYQAQDLGLELDPVLVHVVVRYLREVYPASHPAASAVLERVVAFTSSSPSIVAKVKEGEADPVSAWFASEHSFREFRGRSGDLVDLIVEKLES
jgi:hypothetical protein